MWMALPAQESHSSLPHAVAKQTTEVRMGACGRGYSIVVCVFCFVLAGVDQWS